MVKGYEFGFSEKDEDGRDEYEALPPEDFEVDVPEVFRGGTIVTFDDESDLVDVAAGGAAVDECLELSEELMLELERLYPDRPSNRVPLKDMSPSEVGREGEFVAAAFLMSHGMKIVETNWRCAGKEADIIALDGDDYVMVEVKARRKFSEAYPDEIPELAVDGRKQAGYHQLAQLYMAFHPDVHLIRFDIVAINLVVGAGSRIRHLVSAFTEDD